MSVLSLKNIIDSTKAALLLMGYGLGVTIFIWVGMYVISFIPIIGQGQEALFSLSELTVFWIGTVCGILSLFIVASFSGGEVTFKLKSSIEKET